MEERRRNNRIKLTSTLLIKRLDRNTQDPVEIEILDVSKSGVGFSCSKPLEIGAVYESNLRIWTQEVLHAFLEIVRIEKAEDGFIYGAIFIGMPEMEASRIELYDTINSLTQGK
ncbi:MAG: PilZ domain-containing protein [Lachnospiraceae bacterium]|nr:PilZ domain-containing protein [Lachnospiraceae bacterium]